MKIFLSAIVLAIFAALASNSFAGGVVTGGGGDVQNPSPVEESAILKAITDSRPLIEAHLMGIESLRLLEHDDAPSGYQKLLSSEIDIYALLKDIKVKTAFAGPCYDLDGTAKDGSIYANEPNTICLSVRRFKEKLTMDNYGSEIAALALHEISHLVGTSEDEATEIQNYFIKKTREASLKYLESWMSKNISLVFALTNRTFDIIDTFKEGKLSCDQLTTLQINYVRASLAVFDFSSGLSMVRDLDNLSQLSNKFISVNDYLCSLPEVGTPSQNQSHLKRYDLGFAGKSRVKAFDYLPQADGRPTFKVEPKTTLWIDKLTNSEEAIAELLSLSGEINLITKAMREMSEKKFAHTPIEKP